MATANERLFHADNTHQIGVIRVSRVKEREIERHFTEAQRDIIADVFENDYLFTGTRTGVKKRALERIIARNQSKYIRSIANFKEDLIESLTEFGEEEVEYNEENYKEFVNIEPVGGFKTPTANDILVSSLIGVAFTRNLLSEEEVKTLPQYRRLNTVQKRQLVGTLFTTQSWFQNLEARTRSRISETIIHGYENGLGPSATARNLRRRVGGVTRRSAEGIVRTAYTHVANVARIQFYDSIGQRVRKRYNAVLDERTTDICGNLDGLEWWSDDPALREPPQHFRAFVPTKGLTFKTSLPIHIYERPYKGHVFRIRTKRHNLTITPNHPVFLANGDLVKAESLKIGDKLLTDRGILAFKPEKKDKRELFSNVLRSFGKPVGVKVPITDTDFHGDLGTGKEKVTNIFTDRKLLNKINTFFREQSFNSFFNIRNLAELRFCPHFLFLKAHIPSSDSLISFFSNILPVKVFGGLPRFSHNRDFTTKKTRQDVSFYSECILKFFERASHLIQCYNFFKVYIKKLSIFSALFHVRPLLNSHFFKNLINFGYTHVEPIRKIPSIVSFFMKSDHIIDVERIHYEGTVYDVETLCNTYSLNGIMNHNCRSTTITILQGDEILGDRTYVARVRGETLNFNKMARERYERGNKKWSDLGKRDRNRLIGEARKRWSREHIGTVPADVNYVQWFNMQSDAFKRGVLGRTRFELYQKGGLKYEDFSDSQIGRRFNLNELRQMNRSAFVRSGLIPDSES